jgi:sulfur relay (sulfurtransferase) DsrF/TusC family protein
MASGDPIGIFKLLYLYNTEKRYVGDNCFIF